MTVLVDTYAFHALIDADENTHASAFHALLVSGRRHLSLVDCVSFEVMLRGGIDAGFTFDTHFRDQGFTVVPRSEVPAPRGA